MAFCLDPVSSQLQDLRRKAIFYVSLAVCRELDGSIPRDVTLGVMVSADRYLSSALVRGPQEPADAGSFTVFPYPGAVPRGGVVLSETLSEFMRALGLVPTGGRWGAITRLRTQMDRLFEARVTARYDDPAGAGKATAQLPVADGFELWWAPRDPNQPSLLPSYIELSERFFNEVMEHPVPLDLGALRELRGSAMRLDIYAWPTYRMSYLRRRSEVPWEALSFQFGGQYSNTKQGRYDFRRDFQRNLVRVLAVYREANVEVAPSGLVLLPSRSHVSRGARAALGA